MEACEVCGFAWDGVETHEIAPRLGDAAGELAALLRDEPARSHVRPAPDRWSALEYGAHVRDVVLNLRDRIILGLAEDNPVPKPMHGTLRVERLYGLETPEAVAEEIEMAAALFNRSFAGLTADEWDRPIFYGWPREATRTLRWVAAQALHEAQHHLTDARDDVERAG